MASRLSTGSLFFLLLLPLAIYAVPAEDWFNGQSVCLYRNLFGVECWGCGITRAVVSVMYLDFSGAVACNRLVLIVFPLIFCLWVKEVCKELDLIRRKFPLQ